VNSAPFNSTAQDLRAGDLVEVLSAAEIVASLDAEGACESLPFMPEMLQFCGRRFRVFKRATKVCDTIDKTGFRRMKRTVLLDGVRCDGADHGGCQAGCMILWKEQWLRPIAVGDSANLLTIDARTGVSHGNRDEAVHRRLMEHTRVMKQPSSGHDVYRCQITALKKASLELPWWDLRTYLEDVSSRNRRLGEVITGLLIMLFNWAQRKRGGNVYPYMEVGILKKTPVDSKNLQVGDKVKVKSMEEIQATLDDKYKNRGLMFDVGMARYCGHTFRVAGRATRIIHEKSGEMIHASEANPMIILDGVICNADYQKFCARSEYVFWREIWLDRV